MCGKNKDKKKEVRCEKREVRGVDYTASLHLDELPQAKRCNLRPLTSHLSLLTSISRTPISYKPLPT
jgi:hypothetical protein